MLYILTNSITKPFYPHQDSKRGRLTLWLTTLLLRPSRSLQCNTVCHVLQYKIQLVPLSDITSPIKRWTLRVCVYMCVCLGSPSAVADAGYCRSVAGVSDTRRWPSGDHQLRRGRLAGADQVVVQGRRPPVQHITAQCVRQRIAQVPVRRAWRRRQVRVCRRQLARHSRIASNQRHRRLFVSTTFSQRLCSAHGQTYTVQCNAMQCNAILTFFLYYHLILAN